MRVILATKDAEAREWLAGVLGSGGFSVVVLDEAKPDAPELRGAELLIADPESFRSLGDAAPKRRVLLSARDGMVDMSMIDSFADVLAVPGDPNEVLARVRHVLES